MSFTVARVAIAPHGQRAYRAVEWRDALVLVTAGVIELESVHGARRRFPRGSVLWLAPLGLRVLRNPGAEPARLLAVSRRGDR